MGSHIFGFVGGTTSVLHIYLSKHTRIFVLEMKSKVFFIESKNGSIHKNRK